MDSIIIIGLVITIISIILHEMAHGYAANALGDPTARLQGRLSGNPLVHIDPLGSVIIPALLFFSGTGILFGWAKPVPYNPYNFTNQKWGEALVAIAGPATNVLLAVIFALIFRFAVGIETSSTFLDIMENAIRINILLAVFNMIPVPPLDGSKILMALLPFTLQQKYRQFASWIERYGLFAMFAFIFVFINFFAKPFSAFVGMLVEFATGVRVF